MNNNFRTIQASTCFCKPTPSIEVYSESYNNDKKYSKRVDEILLTIKTK